MLFYKDKYSSINLNNKILIIIIEIVGVHIYMIWNGGFHMKNRQSFHVSTFLEDTSKQSCRRTSRWLYFWILQDGFKDHDDVIASDSLVFCCVSEAKQKHVVVFKVTRFGPCCKSVQFWKHFKPIDSVWILNLSNNVWNCTELWGAAFKLGDH